MRRLTGGWRNVISVIYRPSKYHITCYHVGQYNTCSTHGSHGTNIARANITCYHVGQYGTWYNHIIIWVVIAQVNITLLVIIWVSITHVVHIDHISPKQISLVTLSLSQYGTWYNHVIIWVVIARANITLPDITCYRLGQHGTW